MFSSDFSFLLTLNIHLLRQKGNTARKAAETIKLSLNSIYPIVFVIFFYLFFCLYVYCSGARSVGQMGSAQFSCGPDAADGPDVALRAGLAGSHPATWKETEDSPALIHLCRGRGQGCGPARSGCPTGIKRHGPVPICPCRGWGNDLAPQGEGGVVQPEPVFTGWREHGV